MTTENNPFDLVGQARNDANNAAEERLLRDKEISDLGFVMGSKQGRRFMQRLLSGAGLWRSVFSNDPVVMAFNEGNRNLGLKMLSDLVEACPEKYFEMLKEHQDTKEKYDNRNADSRNKRK